MANDHYLYVLLATCKGELDCKVHHTDVGGVSDDLGWLKARAQEIDDDDRDGEPGVTPHNLLAWSGFWDGESHADGYHDTFSIHRTYGYKLG